MSVKHVATRGDIVARRALGEGSRCEGQSGACQEASSVHIESICPTPTTPEPAPPAPSDVAIAKARIYVADTNNHAIRLADLPDGVLRALELSRLKPKTSS
jgi:hypothetical protein